MNALHEKFEGKITITYIICITILFYLFRTNIPFLKFPFLLFYSGIIIYSTIYYIKQIPSTLRDFYRNFGLAILLAIILAVSFLLSNKLYLTIFKDIFNVIILFSLFFFMTIYIKTKDDLDFFIKILVRFIILFSLIISVLFVSKFLNLLPDGEDISSNNYTWKALIGPLSQDNNFALLPVFLGMIGVIFILREKRALLYKIAFNLILILYSMTIFFSGSRRGLFTLAGIVMILLFIQLITIIRKDTILRELRSGTIWFLISIFSITFLLIGFIYIIPLQSKKNILNSVGVSVNSYKTISSILLYKYSAILSPNKYSYFQKVVWNETPFPLDPNISWKSGTSSVIFPLAGENAAIVPESSIGYKIDRTCYSSKWSDYAYSHMNISSLFKGDSIASFNEFFYASVYCYVSKDFDGSLTKIFAEGDVSGKVYQDYDLSKKGMWQKLSISFKNKEAISPVYLFWTKKGVRNLSNLKGYIVFANPEYRIIAIDPKNPDSGWGTGNGTLANTLPGKNAEIVPGKSIGYKMDKSCDFETWSNNAYSYTYISNLFQFDSIASTDTIVYASVYCFVSGDFNGSWVVISDEDAINGKNCHAYDLNKKNTWQKLQIEFEFKSKSVPNSKVKIPEVYLYWSKSGVTDFSSLKGYLIFAYPQCKIIGNKNSTSSLFNIPQVDHTSRYLIKELYHSTNNDLSKKAIINYSNSSKNTACLIPVTFPIMTLLFSTATDHDPIRKWASRFISEDTTYYGYTQELSVSAIANEFVGSRLLRWEFAWQIFTKEYSWKQRVFGGGFNFLNWYGYYFLKDKTFSDYPHNPFLSILLYSGIIGLILYCLFVFKVFYYYLKYLKIYYQFFIFFLITFFFSFFSAGSPLDPPIMGFFMLMPFFLHSVNKNKNQATIEK